MLLVLTFTYRCRHPWKEAEKVAQFHLSSRTFVFIDRSAKRLVKFLWLSSFFLSPFCLRNSLSMKFHNLQPAQIENDLTITFSLSKLSIYFHNRAVNFYSFLFQECFNCSSSLRSSTLTINNSCENESHFSIWF